MPQGASVFVVEHKQKDGWYEVQNSSPQWRGLVLLGYLLNKKSKIP